MVTNLADMIAPCFDELFFDIQERRHTHYWLSGGRGSTKSSFVGIEVPLLVMQNHGVNAVVMRKVGNTLKNSVYNQILWGIDMLGVSHLWKATLSPLELTYTETNQKIMFFGVDDKAKIKSLRPKNGYVGVCWFEEVDQFAGMEEIRNLLQSLLRGGNRYWCFYSYNPPKSKDNWVNQECLIEEPDRLCVRNTYLDVPSEWLGEQFILEAEKLKAKRLELYEHEYMGIATGTGGDVFQNVKEMNMTDSMVSRFDRLHYGLDFGFAVDPLAFNAMHYDRKREELYIFDEIHKYQFDTRPAALAVLKKAERRLVIADSAEPRTIRSFEKFGCNIKGAKKGPDSVEHGIKWLQDLRAIYIDPNRCPETYKEFIGYEFQQDRNGNFISAFPDRNNHHIDAVRYAMEFEMLDDVYSFK